VNHRLTITAALASAAASTGLFLLIVGGNWFWGGLGAIIVVALIGTPTRVRVLPPVVCLLAALGGLLLYLNLVYEAKYSFLHLLPTGASLAGLWRLGVQGLNETQRYASPVPPLRGIVLLATAGIGLVAVLTDLIAVRLRRCALAGLPLLVLFSVPVASGAGKNTAGSAIVFCLGMAGYLALLSADGRERLRLWGRLVTPWTPAPDEPAEELGSGPSTRALAASGRRIGLAAVALALFVPVLVPSLQAHKIFPSDHHGPGFGPGSGHGEAGPTPLVLMNRQLNEQKPSVVLTYHTTDPHPQYLQMFVLGTLNESGWSMSPVSGNRVAGTAPLRPVPGGPHGSTERTDIHISGSALAAAHFLPVPYAPRELYSPGSWEDDPGTLMLYTGSQSLNGLKYSVNSLDVDPSPAQLADAPSAARGPMGRFLWVPRSYESLGRLADKIVRGADTPWAKAAALQRFFLTKGNFTYSLTSTPASGAAGLKDFLNTTRQGYCQQFAFAMAVLARLEHIPSRVVVGYTAGARSSPGNYVVKTSDAHAWPELYFPGFGWLRMEPTPSGTEIGQGTAQAPAYSIPPNSSSPGAGGSNGFKNVNTGAAGGHGPASAAQVHKAGFAEGGLGDRTATKGHSNGLPLLLIALAALLVIGLVTPRVTRSLLRRRRWLTARTEAARAHAAWAELLDDMADYGIRHGPGETPRAVEKRVARRLRLAEPDRQALLRITQAEERASYATEPAPSGTLHADVVAVRRAVSASATSGARWQARLLPASATERARQALSHSLDLFGWLEVATGRVRRRLARARTG
jgi:TgpA N-terminal domain/Transglutaminase-like superfamily